MSSLGALPAAISGESKALLDALPAALLALDAEGRAVHANARALEILGRSASEIPGTRVDELLAPLDELRLLEPAGAPASAGRRLVLRGARGGVIGFRLGSLPVAGAGPGVPRHLVVFQDITNVERLREERDQLLRLAAVGETLPAVLHEIKNPLAAITTAVEVLLEEVDEGHLRTELTAVLGEVRRIKLALEGIGLFRTELHSTRRSAVDRSLREAFLVIEPQLRAKGIKGLLRVPDLPPLLLDSSVVRAFFFNLVTNAIHACEPGAEITASARLDGETFELVVKDTGCGMSPEVLARCRELFYTTKSNGSGIGLALCASVAEGAGGELSIVSRPGSGTTVTVRLPVRADRAGAGRTERGT